MPRRRYAGSVLPPHSEAKSVPAWNRVQAAQATRAVVGDRQVHRHGRRVGGLLGRDLPDQAAPVLLPHPLVQVADRGPVGRPPVRVLAQVPHRDALGRRSTGQPLEHLVHPAGDERLLGIRLQARCPQPVRQVGRPVVAVVLPLEAAPQPAEVGDRVRDRRISRRLVEIGPHDAVAPRRRLRAPSAAASGAGSSRRSISQPADGATGARRSCTSYAVSSSLRSGVGHRLPRPWRAGGSRCASRCRQPCRR